MLHGVKTTAVGFLSGQRMIVADTNLADEDERFSVSLEGTPQGLTRGEGVWYALMEHAGSLEILTLDDNLSTLASSNLTVSLPGTVLSYDLTMAEDALFLRVEGLLSSSHYRGALPLIDVEEIDAEAWPPDSDEPVQVEEPCDGRAAVVLEAGETWCSFEHGLLRLEASTNAIESVRLPCCPTHPALENCLRWCWPLEARAPPLKSRREGVDLCPIGGVGPRRWRPPRHDRCPPHAYGNDSSTTLQYTGTTRRLKALSNSLIWTRGPGLVSLSDAKSSPWPRRMTVRCSCWQVQVSAMQTPRVWTP